MLNWTTWCNRCFRDQTLKQKDWALHAPASRITNCPMINVRSDYIVLYKCVIQKHLALLQFPPERLPLIGHPVFNSMLRSKEQHTHRSISLNILMRISEVQDHRQFQVSCTFVGLHCIYAVMYTVSLFLPLVSDYRFVQHFLFMRASGIDWEALIISLWCFLKSIPGSLA